MTLDEIRTYCLGLPGATEGTPFGPDVIVFKVGEKLFALTGIDDYPPSLNLKCDPERSVELRESYEAIKPGYHMNKRHWNTVTTGGDVSRNLLFELIDHSYDLVRKSLPQKAQIELDTKGTRFE